MRHCCLLDFVRASIALAEMTPMSEIRETARRHERIAVGAGCALREIAELAMGGC